MKNDVKQDNIEVLGILLFELKSSLELATLSNDTQTCPAGIAQQSNVPNCVIVPVLCIGTSVHHKLSTAVLRPIFLKMYHFIFHFMLNFVRWDVVILILMTLKTHVWLLDC